MLFVYLESWVWTPLLVFVACVPIVNNHKIADSLGPDILEASIISTPPLFCVIEHTAQQSHILKSFRPLHYIVSRDFLQLGDDDQVKSMLKGSGGGAPGV